MGQWKPKHIQNKAPAKTLIMFSNSVTQNGAINPQKNLALNNRNKNPNTPPTSATTDKHGCNSPNPFVPRPTETFLYVLHEQGGATGIGEEGNTEF
jgi:hypothetical protein